uniref:Uncharacterized protein n=1 Tax=Arundo donax TaxID=35708 RepID=A0A0A9F5B4_ARUDO
MDDRQNTHSGSGKDTRSRRYTATARRSQHSRGSGGSSSSRKTEWW